ncbi:MAG: TetR/AcrR family transcriptional regulator [Deltaproteobacteria bacterium]|nr:TetR/AcrR family transcriptional regulator [Deltaproteobacteria bacterium]
MSELNTKDQILDAAEHLFASQGFHTTSLREITSQAGVNLAAVNYHFRTKEKLMAAVLARRLVPINENRLELLEKENLAAEAEQRLPRVKAIFRAFIQPTFSMVRFVENTGEIPCIIGRAHTDPDGTIREAFLGIMMPLFKTFHQVLCQALPNLEADIVRSRLLFAIGSMGTAIMSRLGHSAMIHTTDGSGTMDIDDQIEQLLDFVTHGMEGA